MRRAGAVLWEILQSARDKVRPGVTSAELEAEIDDAITRAGAKPVMRGYRGQRGDAPPFPGSACICINEEAVHAVPGPRILRDGDLATIDCALQFDGWCADAAVGVVVGSAPRPVEPRLLAAVEDVISACIDAVAPGRRWSEIAGVAHAAAGRHDCWLLTEFAGHGIGRTLHESPTVAFERPGQSAAAGGLDFILRPGMVFTIEPVLVPGRTRVLGLDDGWTIVTADRLPAVHEERTVAVNRRGVSVLTA